MLPRNSNLDLVLYNVKKYLEDYGYTTTEEEILKIYTKYEILDMYLKWEGIIGYTDYIYSIFGE